MYDQELSYQLGEIFRMLEKIRPSEFSCASGMLRGGTIGQQVRHVVELVQCMLMGYESGTVNYDARRRDIRTETDKLFAMDQILSLIEGVSFPDRKLELVSNDPQQPPLATTYHREVLYNTDHAIHHMALIRVALLEMKLDIVSDSFGKAPATIAYEQSKSGYQQKLIL